MIATVAGLDDIDLAAVDAVVWAGAGQHLPPLPAERLICPAGQPHRLLLVDCDDRHHPQLRRWSRFRREQFESAGWFEFDFKNLVARVRRFLSQHPRSLT